MGKSIVCGKVPDMNASRPASSFVLISALTALLVLVGVSLNLADDQKKDQTKSAAGKAEPPKKEEGKDQQEMKQDDEPKTPTGLNDARTISFINDQIEKGWKENKIEPSSPAIDYVWIRRVFIDLIGRIPTALPTTNDVKGDPVMAKGELPYFLEISATKRRAAVIRYLLNHPDYAKNWANLWTVWLITRTTQPGIDRQNLHSWLERQLGENRRYDEIVIDLLTATTGKEDCSGKTEKMAAPANFLLSHFGEMVSAEHRARDGQFEMVPATSRVNRMFLGIQTQCTQCHDHPFIDERKQGQFWGVNVFMRQLERVPPVIQVQNNRMQALRHYQLRDNINANPEGGIYYEKRNGLLLRTGAVWLDNQKAALSKSIPRRQELARLLVNDEFFAKSIVNRMWAHFMGRGFTNPVDDFGEHNPVSHPELLDRLAKDFVTAGYDLHRLMTWITYSKPYQLSSVATASNVKPDADPYFARMQLKAMSPEVLVESIFTATSANLMRKNEERRQMEQDWLRDFTVNFGDDEGNEATFNGTVVQALLLMNGNRLNQAVNGSLPVKRAMASNRPLDVLFHAALCRLPNSKEKELFNQAAQTTLAYAKDREKLLADVLWALLNSNEFILNH